MNIYTARPFKNRNAEDFDISDILDVFVNPLSDLRSPFDYENSIIKGGMGSGKSIYLKANYAYYMYSIMPALLSGEPVVLPVFIRLSDFQHLREPGEIYRAAIIQIIKEIANVYVTLENAERLARLHHGMKSLPSSIVAPEKLKHVYDELLSLTAEQYTEKITREMSLEGGGSAKFMNLGAQFRKSRAQEVVQKKQPGIADVHDAYRLLLGEFRGGLLLLIDEAGSVDKSFFRGDGTSSLFETLMNQLRTAEYIRTKIAVYPHSYSDILVETRYGDLITLTEDIQDEIGYSRFRERAISIMDRYIQIASGGTLKVFDAFEINPSPQGYGDSLEQIIYASGGNVRRLVHILDQCMQEAFLNHKGDGVVKFDHVMDALVKHSSSAEAIHTQMEREFLEVIARVCRSRSTYRFQFPYKSPVLAKYIGKSEEHNVLKICSMGAGRRGTTYEFDYAYCIHHDIPTHLQKDTEKVDKSRSRRTGSWITRVAQISEETIAHAQIPGKVEGNIVYVRDRSAFATGDDKIEYFVSADNVIETDKGKLILQGKRIRFYPVKLENAWIAYAVEIL